MSKAIEFCFVLVIVLTMDSVNGQRGVTRERGGGVKIGGGAGRNTTLMQIGRGSGIKIGAGGTSILGAGNSRITTTSTTPDPITSLPPVMVGSSFGSRSRDRDRDRDDSGGSGVSGVQLLHIGLVVPYKSFGVREYHKAAMSAKSTLQRKLNMFKRYDFKPQIVMKELTPSPTEFLSVPLPGPVQ